MNFFAFLLYPLLLFGIVEIPNLSPLHIKTPQLSALSFKKILLDNGLHVLMIQDPSAPFSGASLCVETGSFDDPTAHPGMAHYVEHLLSMGSTKYPSEDEYHRFMTSHGGYANASTYSDRTVYTFCVETPFFLEGFDRFAHLIRAPLFLPSALASARSTLHQEFNQYLSSDQRRAYQVKKHLSHPEHPFSRFSIGNTSTLHEISPEEVSAWFHEHYTAKRMFLVVYSNQGMEELQQQVSSLLTPIEHTPYHPPSLPSWYLPEAYKTLTHLHPLHEHATLELEWVVSLPDDASRPDKICSYILGHEGSSSLLHQLKQEHLAHGITTSSYRVYHSLHLFSILIQLTEEGVSHYEQVVERVLQTLAMMRQGVPPSITQDIQTISTLNYAFQQRPNLFEYIQQIAYLLPEEPLETFPSTTWMPQHHDPQMIETFLSQLSLDTMRLFITTSQEVPSALVPPLLREEPWMGVPYHICYLSTDFLERCATLTPHPSIQLPPPNPFLPHHLETHSIDVAPIQSMLLHQNDHSTLYYTDDHTFGIPHSGLTLRILSPLAPSSPMMTDLTQALLQDQLTPLCYEAKLAGLHCSFRTSSLGIHLCCTGFSEQLPHLIEQILSSLWSLHPSPEAFERVKTSLLHQYADTLYQSVLSQGSDSLLPILIHSFPPKERRIEELKTCDYEHFLEFVSSFCSRSHIQGSYYGPTPPNQLLSFWSHLIDTLSFVPYPPSEHIRPSIASFPKNRDPICMKQQSSLPGYALLVTLQPPPPFTPSVLEAHALLATALSDPFFSTLRTQQQTAYLAWVKELILEHHPFLLFLIQSSSHTPTELLSRIELFIESSLLHPEQWLTEEQFLLLKEARRVTLEHPGDNLLDITHHLDTLLFDHADPDWTQQQLHALDALSYHDMIEYAHTLLSRTNHRRLAIAVTGKVANQERFEYKNAHSIASICKKMIY